MLERDESEQEPRPLCATCGAAKECAVWGVDVCYPCANQWQAYVGEQLWAEEMGLGERFVSEAKRRTLAWAKARKVRAA